MIMNEETRKYLLDQQNFIISESKKAIKYHEDVIKNCEARIAEINKQK